MSQVTLTYLFTTAAQAAAFAAHAAAFLDGGAKELTIPTLGKPADKKDSKAKPAETPSTASPAPAASATPPAASPAPASAEQKQVKYEDTGIGEMIQQLVQKDRAAAVALLGKFGTKKGSELKPDQFDAFKTEITAALNPQPADDLA